MADDSPPVDPSPRATLSAVASPGVDGVEMLRTACLLILAGLAILAGMYLLAEVLVPFVLAIFLALLLNPLIDAQVRRLRWPRLVAVGATFLVGVLVLTAIVTALVPAVLSTVERLPGDWGLARAGGWIVEHLPDSWDIDQRERLANQITTTLPGRLSAWLLPAGGEAVRLLGSASLVLVFLLFLLAGRGDRPVPRESMRGQVEQRIQGYLAITFLISAATGLLVGLTLWLLGVRLAWLFGALAFVLNFIPTVGSAVATLLPMPLVLFDPALPTWVKVAAFVVPSAIQFSLGNVLAPKLLGDRLQLSPVAVMLGLILFGAIWGLAGMVLSTPLLATLKIAFERVPLLTPIADALAGRSLTGDEPATTS